MNAITKDIKVHAARLCQAIARIGYEPQIALMDIVDNAVTAQASIIDISIYLSQGKTLKNRNSVEKYQIVDDGVGMTDDEISNAFDLGANGNYAPNSLSKYGMGLKSAGLSLGTRIHIVSKRNGELSARQTFDIDFIAEKNSLVIRIDSLTVEETKYYESLLTGNSGTVIEIDGCDKINHQSPNQTVRKLEDHMGVVYASFLSDSGHPLNIGIRVCAGNTPEFKKITPLDILFRDQAKAWDPERYDFVSPYLLLDEAWTPDLGDGKNIPPIRLAAVALPQDKLGGPSSPLSPEQKKIVNQYQVSRQNGGVFHLSKWTSHKMGGYP